MTADHLHLVQDTDDGVETRRTWGQLDGNMQNHVILEWLHGGWPNFESFCSSHWLHTPSIRGAFKKRSIETDKRRVAAFTEIIATTKEHLLNRINDLVRAVGYIDAKVIALLMSNKKLGPADLRVLSQQLSVDGDTLAKLLTVVNQALPGAVSGENSDSNGNGRVSVPRDALSALSRRYSNVGEQMVRGLEKGAG